MASSNQSLRNPLGDDREVIITKRFGWHVKRREAIDGHELHRHYRDDGGGYVEHQHAAPDGFQPWEHAHLGLRTVTLTRHRVRVGGGFTAHRSSLRR